MKALIFTLLATGLSAFGELTFQFDYTGSSEFNNATSGAMRRQALEAAGSSLGAIFNNNATIQISATSSNDSDSDSLASAGSESIEVDDSFFGYAPGVVMKKILTGVDDNDSAADGSVDVNFGQLWDLDDDVSADRFDFKATIIHELLHALGFSSSVSKDGLDIFDTPTGDPGVWDVFDNFLTDSAGNELINDSTFALDANAWTLHSTGGSSPSAGLFFGGPEAKAANDGNPIGLYSPTTWEDGSSGSHIDDHNVIQYTGLLMLSATDTGAYRRTVSRLERAILKDLGYDVKPVADPELQLVSVGNTSARLMLIGQLDTNHQIEVSSTFATNSWGNANTVMLDVAQPSAEFTVSYVANTPRLFFRAREVPTAPPAVNALARSAQGPPRKFRR